MDKQQSLQQFDKNKNTQKELKNMRKQQSLQQQQTEGQKWTLKQKQVSHSVTSAMEEANKKQCMQFLSSMHSVQRSEFALQPLTDTKPSQISGEAPECTKNNFNQLSLVDTIQLFEKHNHFPEKIKKQIESLVSLDKKRRQTAQERQYALEATCGKCHQLYKNDINIRRPKNAP